jgi:hypothetical protein
LGSTVEQRHREAAKQNGSGPDRFLAISFARARFDGEANFSGRSFEQTANFTNARFYHPPVFDAAAKDAQIDFTGARFGFAPPGKLVHCTEESVVPLRLRTLRKLAEDTKNHDLERDLYIEERKGRARRLSASTVGRAEKGTRRTQKATSTVAQGL